MKKFLLIITLLCSIFSWGQTTLPVNRTTWNSTPIGWTDSGTGSYLTSFACSGNNGGRLDDLNDYYEVFFTGVPNLLTYDIKISGSSISSLLVQESANGSTWTTVVNHTTLPTSCTNYSYTLNSLTRYVRWTYNKATQNITIDDVIITVPVIPSPEINVQGNSVSIVDGDTAPTTADHTDFGTVLTSTNITRTFTIQNLGTANLVMPSNPVTLSNTTNGFTITQPSLLTIPAGSSTTFSVTFNSAIAGTFTNTVIIANNDSDENPYDYAIVANAVAPTPEINIAKDLLSSDIPSGSTASTGYNTIFAALNIGSNSNKTYYIENEGTANLTIGAVTIIGANPGDFSISAIPSTINVGSVLATSIPFTITFTPQASGVRTATISIVNNDSNENPYTFDVQGTGTCPSYTTTLSPSSGPVGTTVYITSTMNLTGTNTVTLNGTALPVTVISSTQISAVIPSGANTGNIIVTNFQGCSTTNAFTVINNITSGCEGGGAAPTELFISEVTDANTGGLSYIEIYNATGSAKILGTYTLHIYNNGGSTVGTTITLPSVSLANGSTYVVAVGTGNPICSGVTGSDASLASTTSGAGGINFTVTENDHIKLYNGATEIDRWGTYLSNSWADGLGLGTEGANFKRKSNATAPSLTYNSADWDILNWATCANNDYSNIGSHNYSLGVPPIINTQPTYSPSCGSVVLSTTASEGFAGGFGLAYQWYVNVSGSGSWTAVTNGGVYSGATSATLSISSTTGLNNYQYYCQVRENTVTCYTASNVVNILDDITTWNGTVWSNGAPTLTKKAILTESYDTGIVGSFDCCSLELSSSKTLTIETNSYVNVNFNIINNGTISIKNSGSLVQIDDSSVNSGTGSVSLARIATIKRNDYVYWSSPTFNSLTGKGSAITAVSTGTPTSFIYKWTPTQAGGIYGNWTNTTEEMIIGKGYIVRGPSTFSTTVASNHTATFTGKQNNGVVTMPVERGNYTGTPYTGPNGPVTNEDDNWNLIGNPYPSAIDAIRFLQLNTNITGNVRIWTHGTDAVFTNPNPFYLTYAYNYSESDYAIYNISGTSSGPSFNGKIASAQGFFISMNDGPGDNTQSVFFNNSMRNKTHNNSQFFKTSIDNATVQNDIERNRIWIDLLAPNGEISRTLVGYIEGATMASDRLYDASIQPTGFYLYSLINNEAQTIQGRQLPFNAADVVPMGMHISAAGSHTIAISNVDGLFSNASQNIYLEDKLLNVIHDLRQAPYTFTTVAGQINNRFELRYTNTVLSNQEFENTNGLVIVTNEKVSLVASENIESVLVFDLLGRKVYEMNSINSTEVVLEKLMPTKAALIVKTIFNNGKAITKKIIF